MVFAAQVALMWVMIICEIVRLSDILVRIWKLNDSAECVGLDSPGYRSNLNCFL